MKTYTRDNKTYIETRSNTPNSKQKRIRKKKSNELDHALFIALLSFPKKIKYHMRVPYELCLFYNIILHINVINLNLI